MNYIAGEERLQQSISLSYERQIEQRLHSILFQSSNDFGYYWPHELGEQRKGSYSQKFRNDHFTLHFFDSTFMIHDSSNEKRVKQSRDHLLIELDIYHLMAGFLENGFCLTDGSLGGWEGRKDLVVKILYIPLVNESNP